MFRRRTVEAVQYGCGVLLKSCSVYAQCSHWGLLFIFDPFAVQFSVGSSQLLLSSSSSCPFMGWARIPVSFQTRSHIQFYTHSTHFVWRFKLKIRSDIIQKKKNESTATTMTKRSSTTGYRQTNQIEWRPSITIPMRILIAIYLLYWFKSGFVSIVKLHTDSKIVFSSDRQCFYIKSALCSTW